MVFEQAKPGENVSSKADENKPKEPVKIGISAVKKSSLGAAKDSKNFTTVFLTIIAFLSIVTLSLFVAKNNIAAKNRALHGQLEAANTAKVTLQQQLDEVSAIKNNLQSEVDKIKQEAEALSAQIQQEKQLKESAMAQLAEKAKEVDTLKQSIETERQDKLTLKQVFEKETESLKGQLNEIKMAKESLEKKLKQALANKGIKLDKIVVKPEAGAVVPEGQVLVVNKEFDFVVVNLGENDGLKIGSRMQVYDGEQLLGTVEVEKIYGNMSAATIMPDAKKDKIKEGCTIKPV